MIRIVSASTVGQESLVGKFVLFDGDYVYANLSKARQVVGETDKSIVGRTFSRSIDDAGGTMHSIALDDFEENTFRKSSVRCVCDSLAEVDHVIGASKAARELFNSAISKTRELILAVDGIEIDDPSDRPQANRSGMTP